MSIETTPAAATLTADAVAEGEPQARGGELMARAASVLFAAGAVFFACLVAVLTQLR